MAEPLQWRKSSYSDQKECVEVTFDAPGEVRVRDSKNPAGGSFGLPPETWPGFLQAVREGLDARQ